MTGVAWSRARGAPGGLVPGAVAYHVSLILAAVVIGGVSVALSLIGLELGSRLGARIGERGEAIGGLVLIGVGAAIAAGALLAEELASGGQRQLMR